MAKKFYKSPRFPRNAGVAPPKKSNKKIFKKIEVDRQRFKKPCRSMNDFAVQLQRRTTDLRPINNTTITNRTKLTHHDGNAFLHAGTRSHLPGPKGIFDERPSCLIFTKSFIGQRLRFPHNRTIQNRPSPPEIPFH